MKARTQLFFWFGILILFSLVFNHYFRSISETIYFVAMLMPVVVSTSYFFNYFLIPRFLHTRQYLKLALYAVYMLIVSLYLEMIVIMLSFILLASYSYDNMSPVTSDVFVLTINLYFIVLLFSMLQLIFSRQVDQQLIKKLVHENKKLIDDSFTIRSDRQLRTILYNEVLFVESLADYVKIHLQDDTSVITKEPISKLAARLPAHFMRVHRSFIVNQQKVSQFNREEVMIGQTTIPISRTYRKESMEKLKAV